MNWKKRLATYTLLITITAAFMHLINKLVYFIATIDNLLGDKNEKYYEWRFGKIYYTKQGKGSPILLIHDLNACGSSYEWSRIIRDLEKTNTVYALDLLGCGRSDKPNLTYTNFLYVQLVTDFIKHVIGEQTDVIATGISGTFVFMACANNKSIINRIMLINPESLISLAKIPTKQTQVLRYLISMPILGTLLYNILVNKRTIEDNFRMYYYYNQNNITERDILTYFEASHNMNTRSKYLFASIISRYTNANIMHCLQNIDNSIFILVGNANPENALNANQYQNQLPSIEIVTIDEAKHLPHLESPKKFIEQVKILFEAEEQ